MAIETRNRLFVVGMLLTIAGLLGPTLFLPPSRAAGIFGLRSWVISGYALSLAALLFVCFGTDWKRVPLVILASAEALFWYVMTIGA